MENTPAPACASDTAFVTIGNVPCTLHRQIAQLEGATLGLAMPSLGHLRRGFGGANSPGAPFITTKKIAACAE
jgi:hypothetical protein